MNVLVSVVAEPQTLLFVLPLIVGLIGMRVVQRKKT
jgi:hypothetical protein